MHQGDTQVGAVNAVTIIRDAFALAGRHAAVVFGASIAIQASVVVVSMFALNSFGMFGMFVWLLLTGGAAQVSVGMYTLLLLHLRHGHAVPSVGYLLKEAAPFAIPLCWLSFITSVGIGIGLIFLIVPGVILALRWAVAAPALVARRVASLEAIKISSEVTKDAMGTVFALTLIMAALINVVPRLVGGSDPTMPIENVLLLQAVIAALAIPVVGIATGELFLRLSGVPNRIVPGAPLGGTPVASGPYVPTAAPAPSPAAQPYTPGQAYAPAPAYAPVTAYAQPAPGVPAQPPAPAANTYVQPPAHQPYAPAPIPPPHQLHTTATPALPPTPGAPEPSAVTRTQSVAPPGMG